MENLVKIYKFDEKYADMFSRNLSRIIEKELLEKEVLIIYGARQVGKTTILKKILQDKESILLNCEKPSV